MIDYSKFYAETEFPFDFDFSSPSIAVFFNERRKLFQREFKKIQEKKTYISVLDIGTGTGGSIFALTPLSREEDYFLGIDINPNFLSFNEDNARKRGDCNVDFARVDLSSKDWAYDVEGKFDLIIFSEVIEHLYPEDQENALRNIKKLLAKDGVLIIACPNTGSLAKKILRKAGVKLKGSEGHVAELSYSELSDNTSKYFDKVKQGAFTFSYGHRAFDRNNFMMMLFLFTNSFFTHLAPSKCFDQFIILEAKQ